MKYKPLYWFGRTLAWLYGRLFLRVRVSGVENIPTEGGLIVASNHISYFDPPVMGSFVPRELHFFAKHTLFSVPLLGFLIRRTNAIPVRRGSIDRAALEQADRIVSAGKALVLFPEGTRSRTGELRSPKSGVGILAHRTGCPVVPVYVQGLNTAWRCFFGRARARIVYGEPLSPDRFRDRPAARETYDEIAGEVMARIIRLRDQAVAVKTDRESSDTV